MSNVAPPPLPYPPFISIILWTFVLLIVTPESTFKVPLPSGAIVILLLLPSSIVIEPEFVPLFVLRVKSLPPSVVIVGLLPPTLILPLPSGVIFISPSVFVDEIVFVSILTFLAVREPSTTVLPLEA